MFVIKYRKIFYIFSAVLVSASVLATLIWGIRLGIDFVGGSILEINYPAGRPSKDVIQVQINSVGLEKDFSVRATGESGYIIRSTTLTDEQKDQIVATLKSHEPDGVAVTETDEIKPAVEEVRFNTIGPTLGKELTSKGFTSIFVVALLIVLFIAYAFRHVSKPVSSWKYGLVAVIAFVHDVSVPVGLFAFLGRFYGVEVDTLFIVAILVVLGYSINDTIVIFDRIRDNLKDIPDSKRSEKFERIVGDSLKQVFTRSINTSLTTLMTLVALFVWGGESTKWFALALIAGITAGTYSSIFFASPMLVTLNNFKNSRKNKSII